MATKMIKEGILIIIGSFVLYFLTMVFLVIPIHRWIASKINCTYDIANNRYVSNSDPNKH